MKVPVFRAGKFRNGAIKEMVPGGIVTAAHIQELADNTGKAMRLTKWRPRVKHGHGPNSATVGWVEKPPTAEGRFLFADLDLNENGKALVKGKQARFISAEIDKGRSLYGDEDSEKLGLRFGAVALLSREDPQIKDLCDLAEAEFSDSDQPAGFRIIREMVKEDGDRVAYFAEFEESVPEPTPEEVPPVAPQPTTKPAEPVKESAMTAEEEKALRDQLEAQRKETERLKTEAATAQRAALFSERKSSISAVATAIKDAQKALKLGADEAKALGELYAIASFSADERTEFSASFSEAGITIRPGVSVDAAFLNYLKNKAPIVPEPLGEGRKDEPTAVNSATFSEAAKGDKKAQDRIEAALEVAREKNPKLTYREFAAQYAN